MGFHADDEFLPQPSGGFGAGVTGHGAAVSAAALHPTGEHGAVSGGAAADGSLLNVYHKIALKPRICTTLH